MVDGSVVMRGFAMRCRSVFGAVVLAIRGFSWDDRTRSARSWSAQVWAPPA
jgi:hypothetical protein